MSKKKGRSDGGIASVECRMEHGPASILSSREGERDREGGGVGCGRAKSMWRPVMTGRGREQYGPGGIVDLAGNTTLGLSNNDDDSVHIGRGKGEGITRDRRGYD